MDNEEKRRADRIAVALEATWNGEAGLREARVSDISPTGCYVDTIGQAALGDVVDIKVRLPNGDWVTLSGIVVHLHVHLGFGISFTRLSEEQRKSVNQLIDAATH
jgi:hypothetical protein